jgi:radical SAM protein with 4Fe4S-binding SPASM domain
MKHTIDQLAANMLDDQMGIVWGGGDPTANPWVYDAMHYARDRGLKSSFLTNGVFMDVDKLLDIEPALVRVSLNCGTEETYRRFHGYARGLDWFKRCIENMRLMARHKLERRSRTLFGVSLIIDERNMNDATIAAKLIRDIAEEAGQGSIDYAIFRPVLDYKHFDGEYARRCSDTNERARALVEEGGPVGETLETCGIPVVLVKDSFDSPPPVYYYDVLKSRDCLAHGWCGEIRHNGDIQLCSETYGNPEYTVGNVLQQPLIEIWRSDRRREVLRRINAKECFKTYCPHNSRGHHLNRLFHQIERLRAESRIDEVRGWVEDLRRITEPLGHSFFI